MPPEKKKEMKEQIKGAIGNIREQLSAKKKQVNEIAANKKSSTREDAATTKKQATEASKAQYESDLDAAYERIKGAK